MWVGGEQLALSLRYHSTRWVPGTETNGSEHSFSRADLTRIQKSRDRLLDRIRAASRFHQYPRCQSHGGGYLAYRAGPNCKPKDGTAGLLWLIRELSRKSL